MEMKLDGLKEVEQALIRVGALAGQKIMRQALFHASKPILDAARQNVRGIEGGSGALHEALGRTFQKPTSGVSLSGGGRFLVQVGARIGVRRAIALHNLFYRRSRRGIFYGHLVEFGHRVGHRGTGRLARLNRAGKFGKGGTAAGFVRPQPFLRPAMESKSLQATFIFTNQMKRRVERALKKLDAAADNV